MRPLTIHITGGVPVFSYDHDSAVARAVRYLGEATKIYLNYVNKRGVLLGPECLEAQKMIQAVLLRYKEMSVLCGEHPDDEVVRAFNALIRKTIQFR